jgi:hypothetical protein
MVILLVEEWFFFGRLNINQKAVSHLDLMVLEELGVKHILDRLKLINIYPS